MLHGMMSRPVVGAKMGTVSLLILRALVSLIAFIAVPALSTGLNGTGVKVWGTAATGETTPQPNYPRQDADYQKPFNFTKQDGWGVLDNNTGLTWEVKTPQNMNDTFTWYQTIGGAGVGVANGGSTGLDTEKYVAQVNAARLGGYSDWRMPTIKELESIVNYGLINPSIDSDYFLHTPVALYWSSTVDSSYGLGQYVWEVDFGTGTVARGQPLALQKLRLVRGNTLPTSQFTITDNGLTVADASTGLMWKRDYEMRDPANPGDWQNRIDTFQWQEALQRAVADTTGGHTDWRLPNIKELHSLVDERRHDPALDTTVFPPTPFQSVFWSSSPVLDFFGNQNISWPVAFDAGGEVAMPRNFAQYARLVRDVLPSDNLNSSTPLQYQLSVTKAGAGSGTVTHWSINCGTNCSASLPSGTSVTLTAAADSGSAFSGWSGACSGAGACTVTMNQAQSVTATFVVSTDPGLSLSVTKAGAGSGTVTASNINCGTICSVVYPSGTSVTLTATADSGSTFSGWSGACSGAGACTVTMNQAQSATATFNASAVNNNPVPNYTLNVSKAGPGSGTVTHWSINCGTNCSAFLPSGTSVTLTATADPGSAFNGWSGACSGTGTCTVSMNQAQSVTATFVISTDPGYTLSVTKAGAGSGTVTASNINCGTICSVVYPSGTSVTLTATADSGSTFSGWSGAGCSGTSTCVVSMNQAQSVSATFDANNISSQTPKYTLSVTKAGAGSGTVTHWSINCGTNCSASLPSGTSVTLTATADSGSAFSGWSGACSGAGACTVTMNQAQSVTATFVVSTNPGLSLSVTKAGAGSGTVTASNINCGTICSVVYPSGTSVTLTATADSGSTFSGWSGAGCSGTSTCVVSMNQAQNVTAAFAITTNPGYTLSVTKAGTGSGTVTHWSINCGTNCSASLPSGTSVTLTATADPGSAFSGWSGAGCSGTSTCVVSMNQAQSVTATFTLVAVSSVSPYDGIYQWDPDYYLSVHQIGGGAVIATIYWNYTANSVQIGARTIPTVDTFDLFNGQISGSSATISGPRFYRACTLSYDLTFNSDSSLTVRLNSVTNSPGVNTADVDCAARYNPVGSVWTIPRIF